MQGQIQIYPEMNESTVWCLLHITFYRQTFPYDSYLRYYIKRVLENFSLQYQYNIKQISNESKEKMSISGLLVDPIPNSAHYHHMNCVADSKEKY